jgi:hypothetical protein
MAWCAQEPIAIAGSKGLPVFRTPKHSTNSLLQPDPVPSRRVPGRQARPPQRVTNVPNEFIPLEGTNADEETKSPTADIEEVEEGVPLLDEQDGQLDATEIISGDIEKEDT